MKPINDYIVERIRVDNMKQEFPNVHSADEILDFLKKQGFKEIPDTYDFYYLGQYVDVFDDKRKKLVIRYTEGKFCTINFADTSRSDISDDNPMFTIDFYKDGIVKYHITTNDNMPGMWTGKNVDRPEFEKEIEKFFR